MIYTIGNDAIITILFVGIVDVAIIQTAKNVKNGVLI